MKTLSILPKDCFSNSIFLDAAKAIDEDAPERLKTLLTKIGNINQLSDKGATLLVYATLKGCYRAVVCIVDSGADVNLPSRNMITPLRAAIMIGWTEGMDYLLGKSACPCVADEEGYTPLHYATQYAITEADENDVEDEDTSQIQILLHYGANVNASNKSGVTPLMLATEMGGTCCILALVQAGANPDLVDNFGISARNLAEPWGFSNEIFTRNS